MTHVPARRLAHRYELGCTLRPVGLLVVSLLALGACGLLGAWGAGALAAEKDGPSAKKAQPSKEALKALQKAAQLLNAGELDRGVLALEAVVSGFPDDPAAKQAEALLLDFGVGEEVRVILIDRKVFRESFKIKDPEILERAEAILKELRKTYEPVEPFFETSRLKLQFYDSQARFRKATGLLTADGCFGVLASDRKKRHLEGRIEWHLPPTGLNPKDRMLRIRSLLYHEAGHYLTAVHFGGLVPPVINEGISTYLQSRLNTELYVGFRATDRQSIESDARNALNAIAKLEDFEKMLEGMRGFGRGDVMVSRWYGICYATVDFFAEGDLGGRRVSFERFFEELGALCRARLQRTASGGAPASYGNREVLERLVRTFYGVDLATFHAALIDRVKAKYRQM